MVYKAYLWNKFGDVVDETEIDEDDITVAVTIFLESGWDMTYNYVTMEEGCEEYERA